MEIKIYGKCRGKLRLNFCSFYIKNHPKQGKKTTALDVLIRDNPLKPPNNLRGPQVEIRGFAWGDSVTEIARQPRGTLWECRVLGGERRVRCPREMHFSKLFVCVAYSCVISAYFYMFYICIDVKKPVLSDSSIKIWLSLIVFEILRINISASLLFLRRRTGTNGDALFLKSNFSCLRIKGKMN